MVPGPENKCVGFLNVEVLAGPLGRVTKIPPENVGCFWYLRGCFGKLNRLCRTTVTCGPGVNFYRRIINVQIKINFLYITTTICIWSIRSDPDLYYPLCIHNIVRGNEYQKIVLPLITVVESGPPGPGVHEE
jgi:hypothetical protein